MTPNLQKILMGRNVEDSGFDPLSLNWLYFHDPSNPANLVIVSGKVLISEDLTANNYDLTQSTSASRPLYPRDINGKDVLDFTGSPVFMTTNVTALGPSDWTMVVVAQLDVTGGDDGHLMMGHNGGDGVVGIRTAFSGVRWVSITAGGFAQGPLVDTNPVILHARRQGTYLELGVNGVIYSVNTVSNKSVPNGIVIGREDAAGGRRYFNGKVGHMMGKAAYLSTSEVNQIGQWLGDFYGITWTTVT